MAHHFCNRFARQLHLWKLWVAVGKKRRRRRKNESANKSQTVCFIKFNYFIKLIIFFSTKSFSLSGLAQETLRGIQFPMENYDDSCFVDAAKKTRGICKNLAECGSALRRWKNQNIRPQTCYFNKFEHIVCCDIERSPILEPILYMKPMRVKRRSELGEWVIFTIFYIGGLKTRFSNLTDLREMVLRTDFRCCGKGWKHFCPNSVRAISMDPVLISYKFLCYVG